MLTRFARDERFCEVDGCPLAPTGAGDEQSCAHCSFNVLAPGSPRLGCVLATPFKGYERALLHLRHLCPADHERLLAILEVERRLADGFGLTQDQLTSVRDIAKRWQTLLGNDEVEGHIVTALLRFSEASLATGEPVRILV